MKYGLIDIKRNIDRGKYNNKIICYNTWQIILNNII